MDITKLIIDKVRKYGIKPYDINNGLCDEFSHEVIMEMGGYSNFLFELCGDTVFNINTLEWDTTYGTPPKTNKPIKTEIMHSWIYYKGKHYDAESPEGVENWWDLPLCKKFLDYYNK